MKREPKLMIISRGLAPMVFGGTILLNNLLTDYPGAVVGVAGPVNNDFSDPNFQPPCKTYYHNLINNHQFTVYYDKIMEYFPFLIRQHLYSKIKKEKPDIIMAPVPEVQYFIEAYKASKRFNIPFYAHMHDLWQENYPAGSLKRRLADKWEKEILTHAKRVLCMNSVQKDHYEKKYPISCDILPHTITKQVFENAPSGSNPSDKETILFTGAVSTQMNLDALKVIGKASTIMQIKHTLLLCTTWKKEDLEAAGIASPHMHVKYVTRTEVQSIQNKAAVLIAPLSHKNGSMEEIRTVFSTKILEYLVSGRPILIFAPDDSFHALSARKNGWAYVVDKDTPEALAAGILKLLSDENLCDQIVQGALNEAKKRLALPFAKNLYEWVNTDSRK